MKQLVIASSNKGKIREIKEVLSDIDIEVLPISDFQDIKIVEDGLSYLENATKKAEIVYNITGLPTLADDSGLEVFALQGAPGIHSSTFAGENATDLENNKKLIDLIKNIPEDKRGAKYKCVVVIKTKDNLAIFEGECSGKIITTPCGENGFGYDPLFFIPRLNKTMAQLPSDIKNKISHRGQALSKAKEYIKELIKNGAKR